MKRPTPLWETLVMAVSFAGLWAYFAVRLNQSRLPGGLSQHPLSPAWNVALGAALLALVVVFARRIKRVQRAMREELEQSRMPPGMAGRNGAHRNGHSGGKRG